MDALSEAFDRIEAQRKVLGVYAGDESVHEALEAQFSTRNVHVEHQPLPSTEDAGFVVIRSIDGEFRGALGIEKLEAILSPEVHPPWVLEDDGHTAALFDFLDNTLFTAYDRRQMLVAAREIEERAWRTASGSLYTGFQRAEAFAHQADIYDRLARETDLSIRIFIEDDWVESVHESVTLVTDADAEHGGDGGGEIGQFWFVIFDGGGSDLRTCGLLAQEVDPGEYYGFWTYDPALVGELITYLETRYGESKEE